MANARGAMTRSPRARQWWAGMVATSVLLVAVVGGVFAFTASSDAQAALWRDVFGSSSHDSATGGAVDPEGGVAVVGWTSGAMPDQTFAGGPRDAFVRRHTRDGKELWTRQFGTDAQDEASGVAVDSTGVYVVGQTGGDLARPARTPFEGFVRRYALDGTEQWTDQFGTDGDPASTTNASDVALDGRGGLYVAGWVFGTLPGQVSSGRHDAFVTKYSIDGREEWTRQFGTPGDDAVFSVAVDEDGVVFVAGQGDQGSDDAGTTLLWAFDAEGRSLGQRVLGAENELTIDVAMDASGVVYQVGESIHVQHVHGNHRGVPFIRKYDAAGNEEWMRPLTGQAGTDVLTGVAADEAGGVHVAGHSSKGPAASTGRSEARGAVRNFEEAGKPGAVREFDGSGYTVAVGAAAGGPGDVYAFGWTRKALEGETTIGPTDAFVAKLRVDGPARR